MCGLSPANPNLTVDIPLFYSLFEGLIEVENIKIFNTGKFIQAFVEVRNEEDGREAIKSLHKKKLNIGRLKVYFSNKKNITFSTSLEDALKVDGQSESSQDRKNVPRWQKLNLNDMDRQVSRKEGQKKNQSFQMKEPVSKPKSIAKYLTYHDLSKKAKFISKSTKDSDSCPGEGDLGIQFPKYYFLKVEHVNALKVNCDILYNLFSQFGDISELAIDTDRNYAALRLTSKEAQSNMQNNLNGVIFFGLPIFIIKVNDSKLFALTNEPNVQHKLIKQYNSSSAKKQPYSSSTVTKCLIASNLSPETSPSHLHSLFTTFHDPVKIVKIKDKMNRIMFLVEFSNEKKAIETISVMNNRSINRFNMKLAFTSKSL